MIGNRFNFLPPLEGIKEGTEDSPDQHLACINESEFYFNCTGSSLQCVGFSTCVWALEHAGSVVATLMNWPAPQHVGSYSPKRPRTYTRCIGRWILNHWKVPKPGSHVFPFAWSPLRPFCHAEDELLLQWLIPAPDSSSLTVSPHCASDNEDVYCRCCYCYYPFG